MTACMHASLILPFTANLRCQCVCRLPGAPVERVILVGPLRFDAASQCALQAALADGCAAWCSRMQGAIWRNLTIANAVGLFSMLIFLLTGKYASIVACCSPGQCWPRMQTCFWP